MESSRALGHLLLSDEAWLNTLNPWWVFLSDLPQIQPLEVRTSSLHAPPLSLYLSENSLTTLEELFLSPVIIQRKILLSTPIECAMMGNLFKVKLMQFSPPIIAISLDIRTSHVTGILKHMVTILSGLLKSKMELQQVWMLREVGDDPSPTWFDSQTHPYPIINLVVWNCRDWKLLYPEAIVHHLPRVNSDHYPLLLKLDTPPPPPRDRPFRFQPMWLSHPDFSGIDRDAWVDKDFELFSAISAFIGAARVWNKETFGNIHCRKRRLLARLGGAQRAFSLNPSQNLINLRNNLSNELNITNLNRFSIIELLTLFILEELFFLLWRQLQSVPLQRMLKFWVPLCL
ncbi:hypothetical protein FCV25MIE_19395 [Fagus crenata]